MSALLALAAPLMANRLILNLLQSAETIMIPERLTVYGLTRSQAVSTYGTLTGMAMPFVLFPSALVNSLAVVLLPATARHQSAGNDSGIAAGISMSFRYSLYLGIFASGSSQSSEMRWAYRYLKARTPDPSFRSSPGSARFSISPPHPAAF